ncbi:hypothetical protein [Shewanella psychrotolerans]|uniref:hypothetical protein n=1 Tax=Shewanella psychrotolerans TaxID=2864206 RepID=UPI001C65FB14|nr:hypothetical protein [Shewanella psychrotolerans]QYK01200.1 hypothetical protein K0I62_17820 [Shewanella psychrotolerans]
MNMTYNNFLLEGYWWLSLLGGLHCIGLGIYIRYLYHDQNGNHKLLSAQFSLLALYFFTGLLSKHNSPLPMQLLFILVVPVYFLMMPLLYLYCYRSLHNIKRQISFSWHFSPALILIITIGLVFTFNSDFSSYISTPNTHVQNGLSHVTLLGSILPGLLSLQTAIYFYLIIKLLKQFRTRSHRAHQNSLKDIKFRWLLALTFAMLANWLVRTMLVILPFYFGDHVTVTAQAITRLCLLLTVYTLAIYGLKQITTSAYLRGSLSNQISDNSAQKASQQLLNAEELNYLQQVMQDEKNR